MNIETLVSVVNCTAVVIAAVLRRLWEMMHGRL